MGYWAPNREVRIIANGKVYKPLMARIVRCDPCALPGKRYEIEQENGFVHTFAYWELITEWDNARDRYIKWAVNREVARLNRDSNDAEGRAYRANKYGDTPNLKLA